MQIKTVTLQNIKSFENASIRFSPGTNAISGPNGAGKSTIIEAVGLALFGSQRLKQEQMIRLGTASGRIEVSFISSLDGRPYRVIRDLRRTSGSTAALLDEELNELIASGVRDVQEALAQHLGLKHGVRLASVFDGVIGVPQGQLTTLFLLPPAQRKAAFEELLALREYETAFQRLAGAVRFGERWLDRASGRLGQMQVQLEEKPELEGELASVQFQLDEHKKQVAALAAELARVRQKRECFDEHARVLARAQNELIAAKAKYDVAKTRTEEAQRRYDESKTAQEGIVASREGHDAYLQWDARVHELENQLQERDSVRSKLSTAKAQAELHQSALTSARRELEDARQAQLELAQLRPQIAARPQVEAELTRLRTELREQEQLRDALSRAEEQLQSHHRSRAAIQREAERLANARQQLQSLAEKRDRTTGQLADIRSRIALLQAEHDSQRAALDAIQRGEESRCPACQRPFEKGEVQDFIVRWSEQIRERQAEIRVAESQQHSLERTLAQIEEEERAAEQDYSRLSELQSQLQVLDRLIERAASDVELLKHQLQPVDSIKTALAETEAALQALVHVQDECSRLKAVADRRMQLEQAIEQHEEALRHCTQERQRIAGALRAFDGLDRSLAEARKTRDSYRIQYDAFVQLQALAEELSDREQEWRRQNRLFENSQRSLAAAQQAFEELESSYDAKAHDALREQERSLELQLTACRTSIQQLEQRKHQIEAQLADLAQLEENVCGLTQEIATYTACVDLLQSLRQAIRTAGPQIAAIVVQRVSQSANAIFCEIMSDHASELRWREDYDITVRRGAHEREFAQLSGGEQMAASLAVRLALLQELSEVKIAFFDEPTANLDEDRRASLASQIGRVTGFQQLFTISHDDSFETITDNLIRVHKVHDVSVVEQL